MYPQLEANIESVSFLADDGVRLSGWMAIGDSGKAVILLHGYTGDRTAMLPQAKMLFDEGFTVLLFDFRHRGESEGDFVSFGYYEKQDVLAAVNLIEETWLSILPLKAWIARFLKVLPILLDYRLSHLRR